VVLHERFACKPRSWTALTFIERHQLHAEIMIGEKNTIPHSITKGSFRVLQWPEMGASLTPNGGQRSLREISAQLAARGFMKERGNAFSAASISSMLALQQKSDDVISRLGPTIA